VCFADIFVLQTTDEKREIRNKVQVYITACNARDGTASSSSGNLEATATPMPGNHDGENSHVPDENVVRDGVDA
jgi:hypothetical protein